MKTFEYFYIILLFYCVISLFLSAEYIRCRGYLFVLKTCTQDSKAPTE